MDNASTSLLSVALSAAVPLWTLELQRRPYDELLAEAPELSQLIAEKGDVIQFRSKRKGESAAAFNALAKAVAILSFAPGGVTLFGQHFEHVHPDLPKKSVSVDDHDSRRGG